MLISVLKSSDTGHHYTYSNTIFYLVLAAFSTEFGHLVARRVSLGYGV